MPNKLSQFWQELKRRRVIHVIVVYATAAFVILELIDIIAEPFGLPDWTLKLVFVMLSVGLVISIIFSWIYDMTPEGLEKTKSSREIPKEVKIRTPNSWRIATYVSVLIILGLIAFNIFGGKRVAKIDESLARSIAVLPFHNYSGDPEQDYMCEGMTDEIISHLFKAKSFDEVRSFTSVFPYKNSEMSTTEIAEALRVNYILEGSYKNMGNEFKITVQLIEPMSDNHIWLQDYELPYKEVMGIPGEIAIQIADHLKAFLTEDEQQRIRRISTSNQEAYELLKQADLLMRKVRTRGHSIEFDQMLELSLEAVKLDPGYAEAYATVAATYLGKGNYIGGSDMQEMYWKARPYLERALDLDPDCYMAHVCRAMFNDWVLWDYIQAEKEFSYVVEKYPNDEMMASQYLEFLTKMNRLDIATSLMETIEFTSDRKVRVKILTGTRQDGMEAIRSYIHETDYPLLSRVGEACLWLEDYDSARFFLEEALDSEDGNMTTEKFRACLALAYYMTGDPGQAKSIIQDMIARSDTTSAGSPEFFVGWYYSWIGEADSAFIWLEKAYNHRSPEMPWLKVDPAFRNLKEDERYWELYERTGHKAYDDYMTSKNQ